MYSWRRPGHLTSGGLKLHSAVSPILYSPCKRKVNIKAKSCAVIVFVLVSGNDLLTSVGWILVVHWDMGFLGVGGNCFVFLIVGS